MKTTRFTFKKFWIALIILSTLSFTPASAAEDKPEENQSIMLALLLDTSNSMDGLIDQAKSQLWKIVNELAGAKCKDGKRPSIKIALYEYGNDGLPSTEGYVRQVSGLTSDLDLISEKLFSLTTNGGSEYCGYVIRTSLKQLAWSESKADLKMIFIAGNEPFTQGPIPYQLACELAKEKDVVVNSIFCGAFNEGVETSWKRGADLTGGTFMSIEQDRKTVFIPSPYDERIDALNNQLNDTYVYYGKSGSYKKEQQALQDSNAESYGRSNKVERAVSKSGHAYTNSSWDLVDAAKSDDKAVGEASPEYLPKEMQNMSVEQRKNYVKQKGAERERIQKEIQVLSEKRKVFLAEKSATPATESTLDGSMIKAIKDKAKTKELKWN